MKVYVSGYNYTVLLNGKSLQDVIWADDEVGEVEVYAHENALDRRGSRIEDSDSWCGFSTIVLKGNITVTKHEAIQCPAQPALDFSSCAGYPDYSDYPNFP
jgi:hypothetical protein